MKYGGERLMEVLMRKVAVEQQALVPVSDTAVVAQPEPVAEPNLLAVIARAAADPQVDVSKMQALLTMHERITAKQAEIQFNSALARLQPRLPRIPAKGQILLADGSVRSRYMKFEHVDYRLRPLLAEEGFSVSFGYEEREKGVRVTLDVLHIAGHKEHRYLDLPIDAQQSRSQVQSVRSSQSNAKRYMMIDFFNVVMEGEDQDGAKAQPITEQEAFKIMELLELTNGNREAFLKHFRIAKVEDMQVGQYASALEMLHTKLRRQKGS